MGPQSGTGSLGMAPAGMGPMGWPPRRGPMHGDRPLGMDRAADAVGGEALRESASVAELFMPTAPIWDGSCAFNAEACGGMGGGGGGSGSGCEGGALLMCGGSVGGVYFDAAMSGAGMMGGGGGGGGGSRDTGTMGGVVWGGAAGSSGSGGVEEIQLTVKCLSGRKLVLVFERAALVAEVKAAVGEREGLDADSVRLVWQGRHLADGWALASCALPTDATVFMAPASLCVSADSADAPWRC
jgi:hypothetical protein